MALEEETIEILLTTTLEQVRRFLETNFKIKTILAIRPAEDQIQQTHAVITTPIPEPIRQALEVTLIHPQDHTALQTLAAAMMVGDHPEAEEEEDNFYF
jgi:hypothetical protein